MPTDFGNDLFQFVPCKHLLYVNNAFTQPVCHTIAADRPCPSSSNIVVWKRIKGLVDEFWAAFLIGTTYAVSFWVVLIDHISQRMITTNLLIHTANLKESIEEIRY